MKEIFELALNGLMFAFVAGTMITIGLGLTVSQIIEPFKKIKLVLFALIANFVIVPLFALAMLACLPVSEGIKIGVILLSISGGAPFIPLIVNIAKSHVGSSVSLMLLLMVVTIFYIPLILPLLLPGVSVSSWEIAKSLIYSMLSPLVIGLAFKARFSDIAIRVVPLFAKLTNLIVLILIVDLAYLYTEVIIASASALLIILLFFLGTMSIGFCSGGTNRDARIIFAIGTGLRNPPVAMLIANQYFSSEPMAAIVPLLIVIIGLSILIPLAVKLGKNRPA